MVLPSGSADVARCRPCRLYIQAVHSKMQKICLSASGPIAAALVCTSHFTPNAKPVRKPPTLGTPCNSQWHTSVLFNTLLDSFVSIQRGSLLPYTCALVGAMDLQDLYLREDCKARS